MFGGFQAYHPPPELPKKLDYPPAESESCPDHPPVEFFRDADIPAPNFSNGIALKSYKNALNVTFLQHMLCISLSGTYFTKGAP